MLHVHTLYRDVTLASHDSKAVFLNIRAVAVCPALAVPNAFVRPCTRRFIMHLLDSATLGPADSVTVSKLGAPQYDTQSW